jgi:hypothetical protein
VQFTFNDIQSLISFLQYTVQIIKKIKIDDGNLNLTASGKKFTVENLVHIIVVVVVFNYGRTHIDLGIDLYTLIRRRKMIE